MDAEFEQCEPFGIDDGELDGLSPQECFVLGYELCEIHSLAAIPDQEITKTVHAANKDRIEASLIRRGRPFLLRWPQDDVSESWMYLTIYRLTD